MKNIESKLSDYFNSLSLYKIFLTLFIYRSKAIYFILIGLLFGGAYAFMGGHELHTAYLSYPGSRNVKNYLNADAMQTLLLAEAKLLSRDVGDHHEKNFQEFIQLVQEKNNVITWEDYSGGARFVVTKRCRLFDSNCGQNLLPGVDQLKLLIFNEVMLEERSDYLDRAEDILANYEKNSTRLRLELDDQMSRYRKALKFVTADKKNMDSRLLDTYLANAFQFESEIEKLALMKKNSEDFIQRMNNIHPIFISRPDLFDALYSINVSGDSVSQLTLEFQKLIKKNQNNLYTNAIISVKPSVEKVFNFKYLFLGFFLGFLIFIIYALYNSILSYMNHQ